MKVKKSAKKQSAPPEDVAALIKRILAASGDDLTIVLKQFQVWRYPRGDLHAWIPVLDRFDNLLAEIIKSYDLTKLQINDFTPKTKDMLLEILRLQRILMENCTNRKLFNSYDRLADLLLTNDLDVLLATIFVLLRPSQQYAISTPLDPAQRHAILQRLLALSRGWESLVHSGLDLTTIASANEVVIPEHLRQVQVHFYPTVQRQEAPSLDKSPVKMLSSGAMETPTRQRPFVFGKAGTPVVRQGGAASTSSGPSVVDLGDVSTMEVNFTDQLSALAEKNYIPLEEQFATLNKLRLVILMKDREIRRQLLSVRLFALATYVYLASEDAAQSNLFLYEPELVSQLADLLRSSSDVGEQVTTGTLLALCACAHHQAKMGEVMTSVSANVNHGVLVTFFRHLNDRLVAGEAVSFELVDATMSFLAFVATSPSHSNMLMGAGILRLLLEMLNTTGDRRENCIPRAAGLIDHIVFSNPQGLSNFSSIDGVNNLVQRVKTEIELRLQARDEAASETISEETILSCANNPLKTILRSIQRLMQASGGTEGLRNLVDSDLPKSLKVIFQNSPKFGSRVYALAINTMATFVHNEPTSLAILQEMQLPQTLYAQLEKEVPSSSDVLTAISNAVGAVCLNQSGLEYTVAHPDVINNLVSIVMSTDHAQVFNERENARALGLSLDELSRHHPSLRPVIIKAVVNLLRQAIDTGAAFEPAIDERPDYIIEEMAQQMVPSLETQPAKTSPSNPTLAAFTRIFRVLGGLLRNPTIVKDFVDAGGFDLVFTMTDSPCWPIRFGNTQASTSLAHLTKHAIEHCYPQFIDAIVASIRTSLAQCTDVWSETDAHKKWTAVREGSADAELLGKFKTFHSIFVRLTLFADALYALSVTNSRAATSVIKTFKVQDDPSFITNLGTIHRLCFRYHVLSRSSEPSISEDPSKEGDNVKESGVRYLSTRSHAILTKFFKCLVRLIYSKRGRDQTHRDQAQALSVCIADILIDHLQPIPDLSANGFSVDGFALGTVMTMLFDGRGLDGHLNTTLFLAFEEKGGFDATLSASTRIISHMEEVTKKHNEDNDTTQGELDTESVAAIKTVLLVLNSFASPKALLDSPETHAIQFAAPGQPKPSFTATNFFLKIRLAVFPLAHRIWRASWLLNCPTPVIKIAINCFSTLVEGKHEESSGPEAISRAIHIVAQPRPVVVTADPTSVDQLVDMGFPRRGAERALIRSRNNITTATDLLLTMPDEFVDDVSGGDNQAGPNTVLEENNQEIEGESSQSAERELDSHSGAAHTEIGDRESTPRPADEDVKLKEQLQEVRKKYREGMSDRALEIMDQAEALVFDLLPCVPSGQAGITFVVDRLSDACINYQSDRDIMISARLRLASVCLRSNDSIVFSDELQARSAEIVHALPLEEVQRPRWLPALLLFAETVYGLQSFIKKVKLGDSPEEEVTAALVSQLRSEVSRLSTICVTTIRADDSTRDELVAAFRLLALLTRVSGVGISPSVIADCLQPFKKVSEKLAGCHPFLVLVIRHLLDNESTLVEAMQGEIKNWLSPARNKVADIQHFVRQLRHVALREPTCFLRAVKQECALVDPTPPQSVYHIRGKIESKDGPLATGHVDSPLESLGEETQTMMNFLLGELSQAVRASFEKSDNEKLSTEVKNSAEQAYSGLVMSTLTEILGSYVTAKKAFLNGLKQGTFPGALKAKGGISALINDLICCPVLRPDVSTTPVAGSDPLSLQRLAISSRSTAMVVALCSDVVLVGDKKDVPEDIVSIRRTVLDALAKAIRDTSAVLDNNARYGRLWALGELVYRLLMARPHTSPRQVNNTGLHMAKTMLEKNFVGILTNALGEIDLNYPDIRNVLVTLLRALEHLSKLSVKWGKANKNQREEVGQHQSEEGNDSSNPSHSDSESDVDMLEDEQSAPDLYRNSALGMIGGELGDEDEDDDMDDEDEEDDMDMGEDLTDDDDDTASQTSEDESMASALEHDDWADDLDDDAGDSDEDGEMEQEVILGSADEDGEVWDGDSDGQDSYGTDDEDDLEEEGIHAEGIFDDDVDDPEMDDFDDEEAYDETAFMEPFQDIMSPEAAGPWGWNQPAGRETVRSSGFTRADGQFMADEDLLGGPLASNTRNLTEHPLLTNQASSSHIHSSRLSDILYAIENMRGTDTIQMLENFVANRQHNVMGSNQLAFSRNHDGSMSVSINGRVYTVGGQSRNVTSPNVAAEFVPMTTSQRWQEELNMLPMSRNEASSRLVVHIVNHLLPEARRQAAEKEVMDKEAEADRKTSATSAEKIEENGNAIDEEGVGNDDHDWQEDDEDVNMDDSDFDSHVSADEDVVTEEGGADRGPRTLVSIRGRDVDITDTGIDLEFLQALPDEMRADVVEQHMREQRRHQRPVSSNIPEIASQINTEFLNALPPDIRAEVIMQEEMENARRDQPPPPPSIQTGRTSGHFFTAIANELRVLQQNPLGVASSSGAVHATGDAPSTFNPRHREAIQLLEKPGIAVLVRLLFYPHAFKKSYLFRVLVNLCENSNTRNDLLDLLISVVHDGSGDLPAVDRSFQQMSLRGASVSTPKATPKSKTVDTPSTVIPPGLFSGLQNEHVPTFIAQRCFEALAYIVNSNTNAASYFLTEHEQTAGLRKHTSKKGKGKEKILPQTKFPIVVLLGLLDRPLLAKTPGMMETVTALLLTITKPLADRKSEENGQAVATDKDTDSSAKPPTIQSSQEASAGPEHVVGKQTSPSIPPSVLKLIVNCLTAGECTSRTFSQTLGAMQNLACLPESKDIILQELCARCQELGAAAHEQLQELAAALNDEDSDVGSLTLVKFSPPTSTQAQLLRLLKTIDYLHLNKVDPDPPADTMTAEEEAVTKVFQSFNFEGLWDQLGQCLSIVEARGSTEQLATVLLPLVEALMVVSKYRTRFSREIRSPSIAPATSEGVDFFVSFTTAHRKVLNTIVRNNPSLLSGSFSLLIRNPRVLEFDNKRTWFFQKLKRKKSSAIPSGTLHLNIRRQYVFEDSFLALQRWNGEELKYGKLSVKFRHEDGVDVGGVTREWYSVLAQQIFDPNFALFEPCAADQQTYQPNKTSWINDVHLSYFKFVGRVIGKAVYDGRLLDAYFNRAFYKQILGRTVDMRDLESIDPEYHKSLQWMLDNDITGVIDQEFTIEDDQFGEKKTVELKENGANIPVTEGNKEEYVRLVVSYRLDNSIRDQIKSFLEGFYDIIPQELIQIFEPDQLELLISGITTVDVDELKNATQLNGWKATDPEVAWFWRALRSFSQEERSRFLMFVTSSSRVPLGGFSQLQGSSGTQPLQLQKLHGKEGGLPQASTCFNLLLLPTYASYEQLRERLQFAITETGGFGKA